MHMGHASLLVPDDVPFTVLVEVRAVMRVEMLMLSKPDFDWLLAFYPQPMEELQDRLTDWEEVLKWVSLPAPYAKKVRQIVDQMACAAGNGAHGLNADKRRDSHDTVETIPDEYDTLDVL